MPESDAVADPGVVDPIEAAKLARIWTVPNAISFLRLLCLPLFVYVLFGRDNRAAAAWILVGIGATDWIDGYIARNYDQVTTLGKVLDPVADRLLFFVGIGAILIDGSIPVWFAIVVLVREVLVSIGTVVLAALGARRIDVTWFGKTGTFLLMGAVPMFLAAESTLSWHSGARVLAYLVGIPGIACSYWAALHYIPTGRQALREGKAT